MAFIRTKKIKGILYRYRVESVRKAGRVRQRVLAYLGRASAKPAASKKSKATKKKAGSAEKRAVRKATRRATAHARVKAAKRGVRSKKKRK